VEGETSEIASGLQANDAVVMTGVDKLNEGSKVVPTFQGEGGRRGGAGGAGGPAAPDGQGGQGGGRRGGGKKGGGRSTQ
jgi:hypothetical protein